MPPARVVRQRKLGKTTPQQVLRQDEIDSAEYNSLQGSHNVETGVEKSEEKEYHLQAALAASAGGGDKDATQEIPAPPANESADIDYDAVYTLVFDKPATYIRFSQTVEDCTGCQYNMTTEDDVFLTKFNEKRPNNSKCSEDDFEEVMFALEEEAQVQAPYASVDGTVIEFEELQLGLKEALRNNEKALAFARDIWTHWKARKQAAGRLPLQPRLKEEKDPTKDEGDPYICFRRRDARQTRKTRARDVQSTDKLKKLRKEIEEGRDLIRMALVREEEKKKLLNQDKEIFQMRSELKRYKVKLGIKTDDEDLINQKPQKRKAPSDFPQMQRPPGPAMRVPGRLADGRPLESDLILLSDVLAQKENLLRQEIEEKTLQHRRWNRDYVDLTREPLSPVLGQGPETGFRPATAQYQYLMTPPSSVTSESIDHPSPSQEKPEPFMTRYSSPPEEDVPRGQPAYRRRIGRGGRLWIDRRGMSAASQALESTLSDRWKYDQDDDGEQPVYEVDPYDTKALRFRATIPLPQSAYPQRSRPEERPAQQARISATPSNQRTITAGTQLQPAPT